MWRTVIMFNFDIADDTMYTFTLAKLDNRGINPIVCPDNVPLMAYYVCFGPM